MYSTLLYTLYNANGDWLQKMMSRGHRLLIIYVYVLLRSHVKDSTKTGAYYPRHNINRIRDRPCPAKLKSKSTRQRVGRETEVK